MNVYDSERILEALVPSGFEETSQITNADLIVLNTCNIREKAVEKVYSELGRIRKMCDLDSNRSKKKTIAIAGCVAQAEGNEIVSRAPCVDVIVGPKSYHMLPSLVARSELHGRRSVQIDLTYEEKFDALPKRNLAHKASAFLTVQEGCDKFCTFCVVPYTRGMEYSRPVEQLVNEAKSLIKLGSCEIILLGQNVNAYNGKGPYGNTWSLAQLIDTLSKIDGVKRLRYTTSHPRDMSDDLIQSHSYNKKLMPYIHLPFQAGSNRILKAMNRGHTSKEYLQIIDRIRFANPEIAISTDIIVGFPGETAAEFDETLSVVEKVGFAQAFSFKYSPRPGTPASEISDHINETEKTSRLHALQSILKEQQELFNKRCIGKTLSVLFERKGRDSNQLIGRSPYLQQVYAVAPDRMLGCIVQVKIISATSGSLFAVLQDE